MDYDRSPEQLRQSARQPFFTAGEGRLSPTESTPSPDNINLSNWRESRDHGTIGAKVEGAIFSVDNSVDSGEPLGTIVPTLPPPVAHDGSESSVAIPISSRLSHGEPIAKADERAIDSAIAELTASRNISSFYDKIRNAAVAATQSSGGTAR